MEDTPDSRLVATALARRAGEGADAAQIAAAVVSTLLAIDAALSPVLGQGGVVALYRRSLHLAGATYPWLAGLHEGVVTAIDLAALRSVLGRQSSGSAAAGGGALLNTYKQLLTSLVGPSLAERLLRAVWQDFSGGAPAQDTSP